MGGVQKWSLPNLAPARQKENTKMAPLVRLSSEKVPTNFCLSSADLKLIIGESPLHMVGAFPTVAFVLGPEVCGSVH